MDKEKLGLAQYLKNHPILSENDSYIKTTGTFLFCHLWC